MGQGVEGGIHAAEVVEPHQAFENRQVPYLVEARPHRAAGVVDQHVDAAERRDRGCDEVAARGFVGDVGRHDQHLRAETAALLGQ